MQEFNIFIWLAEKLGLEPYVTENTLPIIHSAFVLLVLAIVSVVVWYKIKDARKAMVPSKRFGLRNIMEIAVEGILGLMRGILGDRAERFLPLIGTLFIYILCCNLLGFIPGFISPTTAIGTNFACAIVVFIYYNYVGVREHGVGGYLKRFAGPVIWLAPLIFCIELISHLVRPISLSVRLFGNMTGDHMVLGIFSSLVPIIVPIIFMALGIFISFIQAFVFSILSTVYIAMAIEH